MNEQKKQRGGYIRYASIVEAIEELTNDADKLEVSNAVDNYAIRGIEPTTNNGVVRALFKSFKPILAKDRKQWENGCKPKSNKPTISQQQANHKPTTSETQTKQWYTVNEIKEALGISNYQWRKLRDVYYEDSETVGCVISRNNGCDRNMLEELARLLISQSQANNKPTTSQRQTDERRR